MANWVDFLFGVMGLVRMDLGLNLERELDFGDGVEGCSRGSWKEI